MSGWAKRLFNDEGRYLDRFGALLALTVISVTVNSLIDLEDPTQDVASEINWILVTIITGGTLVLAIEASGVAKRARRIALLIVLAVILGAIVFSAFGSIVTADAAGRPSVLWVFLAVLSPILVTRRLFLQDRVTAETIWGAMAAFLLIALAFDYAFLAIDGVNGLAFFGQPEPTTSFMYFSLVTITTLGYGDLNPAFEWARYLATMEAVIGTIFLVTVVARLVSMFGADPSPFKSSSSSED